MKICLYCVYICIYIIIIIYGLYIIYNPTLDVSILMKNSCAGKIFIIAMLKLHISNIRTLLHKFLDHNTFNV